MALVIGPSRHGDCRNQEVHQVRRQCHHRKTKIPRPVAVSRLVDKVVLKEWRCSRTVLFEGAVAGELTALLRHHSPTSAIPGFPPTSMWTTDLLTVKDLFRSKFR